MTALEGIFEVAKIFFWSLIEGAITLIETITEIPIIKYSTISIVALIFILFAGMLIKKAIIKKLAIK